MRGVVRRASLTLSATPGVADGQTAVRLPAARCRVPHSLLWTRPPRRLGVGWLVPVGLGGQCDGARWLWRASGRGSASATATVKSTATTTHRSTTATVTLTTTTTQSSTVLRLIATVEHVVDGATSAELKRIGHVLGSGFVIGEDPSRDVALVQASAPISGPLLRSAARCFDRRRDRRVWASPAQPPSTGRAPGDRAHQRDTRQKRGPIRRVNVSIGAPWQLPPTRADRRASAALAPPNACRGRARGIARRSSLRATRSVCRWSASLVRGFPRNGQ